MIFWPIPNPPCRPQRWFSNLCETVQEGFTALPPFLSNAGLGLGLQEPGGKSNLCLQVDELQKPHLWLFLLSSAFWVLCLPPQPLCTAQPQTWSSRCDPPGDGFAADFSKSSTVGLSPTDLSLGLFLVIFAGVVPLNNLYKPPLTCSRRPQPRVWGQGTEKFTWHCIPQLPHHFKPQQFPSSQARPRIHLDQLSNYNYTPKCQSLCPFCHSMWRMSNSFVLSLQKAPL